MRRSQRADIIELSVRVFFWLTLVGCNSPKPATAPSAPPSGRIHGQATNRAEEPAFESTPVANIVVMARSAGSPRRWTATTDANGFYVLDNVPSGTYELVFCDRDRLIDVRDATVTERRTTAVFVTIRGARDRACAFPEPPRTVYH